MGKEIAPEIKQAIANLVENYRVAVIDELKATQDDVFIYGTCGDLFTTPKLAGLAPCDCGGTGRPLALQGKSCPCCGVNPIELGRRIEEAEEVIIELLEELSETFKQSPEGQAYLDKMRAAIYKANGGEYDQESG